MRAGSHPPGGREYRECARGQPRRSSECHNQNGGGIFSFEWRMRISARRLLRILGSLALVSLGASCTTVDNRHQVIISIPEQRMAVLEDGAPVATYPVS